jgi:hypothetical protein
VGLRVQGLGRLDFLIEKQDDKNCPHRTQEHTRIASMPLNLDFLWLSLTMMKGLPYSSVAYTAELGSMDIVKAFEVTMGPKVQLRVCHGSQPDKFEKIVANRQSHVW